LDSTTGAVVGAALVPFDGQVTIHASNDGGRISCPLRLRAVLPERNGPQVRKPAPVSREPGRGAAASPPLVTYPELELHQGVKLGRVFPDVDEGGPVGAERAAPGGA
jgi:hypothetical protein